MTTVISGSPEGSRKPASEPGIYRRFAIGRMGTALVPFLLTFLILTAFWLLFSGKYDRFHILFGIAACLIVAGLNHDLLFPQGVKPRLMGQWIRFCGYVPWLLYQVFMANLHVLYLTLHPRMQERIDPRMIEAFPKQRIQVPVTHAKIFGWYDNEYGSYTNLFGDLTVHVHRMME